jgi:hypothetical protein
MWMLRQVKCRVGVDAMIHLRSMAHRGLCGFYVQTGDAYNERPLFRLMRDGAPFALFFARSVCNIPRTPYNIHRTACNAQRTPTIVQRAAHSLSARWPFFRSVLVLIVVRSACRCDVHYAACSTPHAAVQRWLFLALVRANDASGCQSAGWAVGGGAEGPLSWEPKVVRTLTNKRSIVMRG